MKKLCLILILIYLIIPSEEVFSQKENNVLFFGYLCGLDFNTEDSSHVFISGGKIDLIRLAIGSIVFTAALFVMRKGE